MFVKTHSASISGIDAQAVTVEASISNGLGMYLVGLPDSAVKESQDRIRSAFINSELKMPGKRLVVNLAPADVRKEGSAFDLPIAIAILAASEQIEAQRLDGYVITGELSLDGQIKPVRGVLPIAVMAREMGFRGVVVPTENIPEAAVVEGIEVIGVGNLREAAGFLGGTLDIEPAPHQIASDEDSEGGFFGEDFSDVRGQGHVKRALEIAAAGGHNVIMIGAPGSGKTMLARRMPSIMPPMTPAEALETTKVHSVAGKLGTRAGLMTRRPFRAPHHLTSQVALIGGGSNPQPGEVSLAHNGILFMDELPEFGRSVLEVLRQPMEEKGITVSRAKYSVEYPANFTLVASMNPCPCGYYNHPTKECVCGGGAVFRYLNRISGPLMDRIDLHIEVTPVPIAEMSSAAPGEPSADIRRRVIAARNIQRERFSECEGVHTNAMMNSKMLRTFCPLSPQAATMLQTAMDRLNLSARAYDRIIKVARTIADLAGEPDITTSHIAEAINYRSLDRESWGR
ncbi:MAG: YifB family Mg chelatase-like AAA ATPase [Rikenellaceae bacterium]|jgi:magnesium chelatase family protein|nr:YifB family Mg chelatase-like AAA ATPase [Rikenellaceae bacterium]